MLGAFELVVQYLGFMFGFLEVGLQLLESVFEFAVLILDSRFVVA